MKKFLLFTSAIVMTVVTFSCGGDDDNAIENQAPKIAVQSFNISEAAESNTIIATIAATDPDKDQLTFDITANSDDLFAIANTGALSIAEGKDLDFETSRTHTITVEVSDGDLTASAEITIIVIDSDENIAPVIAAQSFTVAEDILDTVEIGTVVATDEGTLTYRIVTNSGDLFEITDMGVLSLATGQSLDFETATSHMVTVEVSDSVLTSTAEITINVTDETGAPVILAQSFTAAEDILDTVEIGTVVATDDESLTYSIVTNSDDLFEITDTGILSLATGQSLDFETTTSHTITVEVSDGELTATAEITITVTNVIDTMVSTLAGSTSGFADGMGTAAQFRSPFGTTVDASGNIYVADTNNHRIRKITPSGEVSTLAGSTSGFADGTGTAAQFRSPYDITVDASGTVYVADNGNHRIRKITPSGEVSTLAGSSIGFADGTGTAARFNSPYGITVDGSGTVYVADNGNHRIRKITPSGEVSTLAGSTFGFADGAGTAARFRNPSGITVDGSGTVYVADTRSHRIRKITPSGEVSTLAGSTFGFADGTGTAAQFRFPNGITVDASGTVYVADTGSHRIRKITPSREVSTLAGSTEGFADGTGTAAQFSSPWGITVDGSGTVFYVTDGENYRIRKITLQ